MLQKLQAPTWLTNKMTKKSRTTHTHKFTTMQNDQSYIPTLYPSRIQLAKVMFKICLEPLKITTWAAAYDNHQRGLHNKNQRNSHLSSINHCKNRYRKVLSTFDLQLPIANRCTNYHPSWWDLDRFISGVMFLNLLETKGEETLSCPQWQAKSPMTKALE